MARRRDVIKGLAALPVIPAFTDVATAREADNPSPVFIHDLDRQLWAELKTLEAALVRVKGSLLEANAPNPLTRNAALLDMRCSFGTLAGATDWSKFIIEDQRLNAQIEADRVLKS